MSNQQGDKHTDPKVKQPQHDQQGADKRQQEQQDSKRDHRPTQADDKRNGSHQAR